MTSSYAMTITQWTARIFCVCIFWILTASGVCARGHSHAGDDVASGQFDYYLMSLSWSPSFCLVHPQETEQCGSKGFGFVLHGLWPQNANGSWPQHCGSAQGPDAATIARTLSFMPSQQLIQHEWQTHGTCSGLDPVAYFERADQAFASVKIPPGLTAPQASPDLSAADVVQAFMQINPGLGPDMISVACRDGAQLSEVRVCLNKTDLSPQSCGGRVRNTCRSGSLRIPAVR
jgi:ribonuclease T2